MKLSGRMNPSGTEPTAFKMLLGVTCKKGSISPHLFHSAAFLGGSKQRPDPGYQALESAAQGVVAHP